MTCWERQDLVDGPLPRTQEGRPEGQTPPDSPAYQPSSPPPYAGPPTMMVGTPGETGASDWYPSSVLLRCKHGRWIVAAGYVIPDTRDILCPDCEPEQPWWQASLYAMHCPHGYSVVATDANIPTPPLRETQCHQDGCRATTHAWATRCQKARDLPSRRDCIRHPGEVDGRAPDIAAIFATATRGDFRAVAFHEHTGAFREAWTKLDVYAASVADRPSLSAPTRPSLHFIICLLYTSPSPRDS